LVAHSTGTTQTLFNKVDAEDNIWTLQKEGNRKMNEINNEITVCTIHQILEG
jgi:hypothetical protein